MLVGQRRRFFSELRENLSGLLASAGRNGEADSATASLAIVRIRRGIRASQIQYKLRAL